jgi:N-acetylglucosaminyl-diphospho-decaprenol L-rhamnosyltransferase
VSRSPTPARLAVVIVTHDTCQELHGCLDSIPADEADEVVVVDAGSTDGTDAMVRGRIEVEPRLRYLPLANAGFGRSANAGMRTTSAPVLVVANADVRFAPGALARLAASLDEDATLGAVGPLVRYPEGGVQASARRLPDLPTAIVHALLGRIAPGNPATRRYHALGTDRTLEPEPTLGTDRTPEPEPTPGTDRAPGGERRAPAPREVDWLSGCALALRRDAIEAIGGFDPGYFLFVEDLDLAVRLRSAGWRIGQDPRAEVVHRVGASTSRVRSRALVWHARSLRRYVLRRCPPRLRPVLGPPLTLALAGWVAVTYLAERLPTARGRSTTGEPRR